METSAAGSTGTARGRLWLLPLVVGVAWCLVFASWADDTARLVLYAGFGSAAILILAGIRAHRPRRLGPWLAVVAGLGLLSAGDIGWFLYGINGSEAPFPSLLDIAYLAGYVVVAVGIGWLFRSRVPGGDRAGLIDAVILACGVGILAWVFLMAPYVADETLS